ncbi:MAG TPA: peptidoglycan-associated lipoprotein Pal [Steroidobacteraceae bacterium]|jgi:peptidoglycan-associated lipoprotein|nr:peptidoglycan-associated lipoprotein Pal [Steroidobacteraceae bacterium]
MQRTLIALLVAASFWIAACASHKPKEAPPPPPAEATTGADANGAAGANAANGGADQETAGPQAGVLAKRTIYFDFDNSEIKGEGTDIVAAHAKYLAANPSARVRLEGNTDERGSREYNIGLGERRAQAVRRALLLQGASDAQLSTVSYGEERPAAAGHDETAWAKNRRVEIVYLTPNTQPAR